MIVALDIGLKRIGLAFGYEGKIALPQNAILRKNRKQAASDLKKILDENQAELLVVGLPKGGSSEEEMQRRIEHFVKLIGFEGKILYIDESFTSKEAQELYHSKKKDGRLDSLAAMLILQRYFEQA